MGKAYLKITGAGKGRKDPDFARFGVYSHKYKLSPPASEETIQKFEEQEGIRLPEEYRDFLLLWETAAQALIMGFMG